MRRNFTVPLSHRKIGLVNLSQKEKIIDVVNCTNDKLFESTICCDKLSERVWESFRNGTGLMEQYAFNLDDVVIAL